MPGAAIARTRRGRGHVSADPPLPGVLAEIEQAAGREAAINLALERGGSELYFPSARHLGARPDHPLVLTLGSKDAALAVAGRLGGNLIYIPAARRACAAYLASGGLTIPEIAGRLGISRNAARRYAGA